MSGEPIILIGERDPERRRLQDLGDELCEQVIVLLGAIETTDLNALADYRDSVHKDGWMQSMIREYVEVWR